MKWSVVAAEASVRDARKLAQPAVTLRPGQWPDRELGTSGEEVLVVFGDDWALARVVTHLHELRRDLATIPAILAVGRGDVTAASGAEPPSVRKLERALKRGELEIEQRPTLRVVDSAERHAMLAFNIGLGLPFELFEARARSGRRGPLKTIDALIRMSVQGPEELVDADVFVDWEKSAERFRLFLASAGSHSWFDVGMGASGPGFRLGKSALELVEARSRLGRIVSRVSGHRAEPFRRIHIDTNSGYVLDGELFDPGLPRTIAIEAGPRVRFAVPP